ncbi:hypothetical protein AN958_01016, partial [Leucoagaricus sp. SymC.cos]
VTGVMIDFSTPRREVKVVVRGKDRKQVGEIGLLDEGSEIITDNALQDSDLSFELVHVPASKHKGLDRLSKQRKSEDGSGDNEGEEAVEEWVDEILGCSLWAAAMAQDRALVLAAGTVEDGEGTILKERVGVDVEE